MLSRLTLEEFDDRLAAGTPTPGGGSAAALAGSLAAALIRMVCDLTIGKEAYRAHEPILRPMNQEAEAMRRELLGLVDQDASAYDGVMQALRLPKTTDVEKAARRAALARANLAATEVPLRTAEICSRILALAVELVPRGNRNALSDIGTAAFLAEAGLRGALMNIRINLGGLAEAERAAAIRARAEALEREAETLRGDVGRALTASATDR
jgi:formiminotetrahydrofolate cyclodeaminase